ncbi:Arm DNA-binding domain-containing protein [Bradyrhizobium sp. Pha-3]|uniref:Arm DNA-binding domain-containing protein n=1 Tax=Bradyrhizobium sp. Pha-3 TaxID=208375 RepID=UPI0035D4C32E
MFVILNENGAPGTIRTSDPQIRSLFMLIFMDFSSVLCTTENAYRLAFFFATTFERLPSISMFPACTVLARLEPSGTRICIGDAAVWPMAAKGRPSRPAPPDLNGCKYLRRNGVAARGRPAASKRLRRAMRQANDRALTKRYVESLKPGARPVVVFDAGLAGFGVRVMPSGHRSYFVQYRNKEGRSRWYTIGAHGKVTVDQARTIAKRVLHSAADGKDPAAERETFRTAPTVSDLLDRYLTEHVKKRNAATTQA